MWSEEIDKKLKESADGHHPPYTDKDWDNMELLLDKSLPVEKKRRRLIVFWLLPLLLTGAGIFFFTQQNKKNVSPRSVENVQSPEIEVIPGKQPGNKEATAAPVNERETRTVPNLTQQSATTTAGNTSVPGNNANIVDAGKTNPLRKASLPSNQARTTAATKTGKRGKSNPHLLVTITPTEKINDSPAFNKDPKAGDPDVSTTLMVPTDTNSLAKKELTAGTKIIDTAISKNEKTPVTKAAAKGSPFSKLGVLVSAGPDISSVGDNFGNWELQYGIALSYALSKRISIRAGFYAGDKIYTADSSDYHSTYVPSKLQKVEADCSVFEIPVNIIYNFKPSKKHGWFVSGGLSSYIMKEEKYDYYYMNNWNQVQVYSRTYKNENTHIFSVVNLSGGYQYNFTDRFFVMAEPYARIPLSGIGHGKVKLNSTGILFSAGFKPFAKKK